MASTIPLPALKRTPTTIQYHMPRDRPKRFYETRFRMPKAARAETIGKWWLRKTDPMMPVYPYGVNVRYREANEGLYGGLTIQSGSKISDGRNKGKTLRKWYPNVRIERIRSEALDKELTIPIAARVMRTIRKCGGLDQYLTGPKPARVKELGLLGWKLRWLVINSEKWRTLYQKERKAIGLSSDESANPLNETFEEAWEDQERRSELVTKQNEKWEILREKDERFRKHYQQNIEADRSSVVVPDLSTLSFYDPEVLRLGEAVPEEEKQTKGAKKNAIYRIRANNAR